MVATQQFRAGVESFENISTKHRVLSRGWMRLLVFGVDPQVAGKATYTSSALQISAK